MRGLSAAVAAVTAALMLTSCTTVVTGAPMLEFPPVRVSPSATTPAPTASLPSPSPSSTAASGPYARVVKKSSIGDLGVADLCSGIDLRALAKWGRASVHGWQTTGTCYLDIERADGSYFQINAWFQDARYVGGYGVKATRIKDGAFSYTFPPTDDDCERAYGYYEVTVDIHIENDHAGLDRPTRCAVTEAYLQAQIKALADGQLPSRSVATPSLTDLNLCALLDAAARKIGPPFEEQEADPTGVDCYSTDRVSFINAQAAFIAADWYLGTAKRIGDHTLYEISDGTKGCAVVSKQAYTADRHSVEILNLEQRQRPGKKVAGCAGLERLAVAALNLAHLR